MSRNGHPTVIAVDVRPHPHIGLATVTYMFSGEIVHRDSLGSEQPIRSLEVNRMTAGRGMMVGGEPLGERFLFWNFVSSSRARLTQAAEDWRAGRMALPPTDHDECIPLPVVRVPGAPALS